MAKRRRKYDEYAIPRYQVPKRRIARVLVSPQMMIRNMISGSPAYKVIKAGLPEDVSVISAHPGVPYTRSRILVPDIVLFVESKDFEEIDPAMEAPLIRPCFAQLLEGDDGSTRRGD